MPTVVSAAATDRWRREVLSAAQNLPADAMRLVQQRFMVGCLSGVVRRSPVGSPYGGHFRGNWRVSEGVPETVSNLPPDPGGYRALADGLKSIATHAPFGVSILANPIVYGPVIEFGLYPIPSADRPGRVTSEGFSKQAPRGVVAVTFYEQLLDIENYVNRLAASTRAPIDNGPLGGSIAGLGGAL